MTDNISLYIRQQTSVTINRAIFQFNALRYVRGNVNLNVFRLSGIGTKELFLCKTSVYNWLKHEFITFIIQKRLVNEGFECSKIVVIVL